MDATSSSDWAPYVERWGMRFEDAGLPPSAGRIWGRLLVCDPDHQSLAQLCRELDISKGTASTSTRLLERQGLLERVPVPGSREIHYRIPPDAFEELVRRKLDVTRAWRRLAEEGVRRAREEPAVPTDRLERFHAFYSFVETRQAELLEEWREKAGRPGTS